MKWEKTITTEKEYEKSLARLSKIFEADSDSPEGMEAKLLVTLIENTKKSTTLLPYLIPLKPLKKLWKEKALGTKT